MAPDQIWPIGLAIPLPAISGADPCTGSKHDGNSLSGFRFADGAIPIVPAVVHELPIQQECLKLVKDPRKGKNMFVLGMLCRIYSRDADKAKEEIAKTFRKKGDKVIGINHDLFDAGYT